MPWWLALAVAAEHHADHDWLVVGGGPVGTLAVAVLLDSGAKNVAWVEPSFERMGRLAAYGSVPANTRSDRLLRVFRSLPALNFDASQERRRERSDGTHPLLSSSDPMGTLPLQASLDALRDGSEALRWHARVVTYAGEVTSLYGSEADGWSTVVQLAPVEVNGTRRRRGEVFVLAEHVILATGAVPRRPPTQLATVLQAAGVRTLEFDDAVAPARMLHQCAPLANASSRTLRGAHFAVVGASHSGMLAARNALTHCDGASVHVFSRGPVRMAEERDGWIKFDGTGLKGDVRDWAMGVLAEQQDLARPVLQGARDTGSAGGTDNAATADGGCAPQVSYDGTITGCDDERGEGERRVDLGSETATLGTRVAERAGILAGGTPRVVMHTDVPHTGDAEADAAELARRLVALRIDALAWTTGFERRRDGPVALPAVSWMGLSIDLVRAAHDGRNGAIAGAPGLHGVGIGFPEWYVDPEGHREPRVGFVNSFVEHMHRVYATYVPSRPG